MTRLYSGVDDPKIPDACILNSHTDFSPKVGRAEHRDTFHLEPQKDTVSIEKAGFSKNVQAGLAIADNCLFGKIQPFSEVKFKILNT